MNTLKKWLPWAFLATLLAGLVYVTTQQSYRQTANDPQIAMAEDDAAALANGQVATISSGTVDLAISLSPYVVVYDETGKPISGNGTLEGTLPNLPPGVFDAARSLKEDRFTWQPRTGVRSAVVLVHVNGGAGGFVMAGRSLREVEIREGQLEAYVGAAWIVALLGTLMLVAFL